MAVHLIPHRAGLVFFGAEARARRRSRRAASASARCRSTCRPCGWWAARWRFIVGLAAFFTRSLYGKALRATAVNPSGAKLMGISPVVAGKLTFAGGREGRSRVLIGPITTIYYDTGFLIGLKGFVGAIIGGLASYPLAAAGAVLVGLLESFSSFWASAF